MSLLIGGCYMIGASLGWWVVDKWLESRRRKREAETPMRNITPPQE